METGGKKGRILLQLLGRNARTVDLFIGDPPIRLSLLLPGPEEKAQWLRVLGPLFEGSGLIPNTHITVVIAV